MRRVIVLAVVGLGAALAARAVIPLILSGAAGPFAVRWPAGATVTFLLNNQIGPAMPNLEPGSNPVAAVDTALATVSAATGLTLTNGGVSAAGSGGQDGTNLITFASSPANAALLNGATGLAVAFFNPASGFFTEVDVIGNAAGPWSTLGTAGWYDLQALVTHELGHGVGLEHGPSFDATMWPVHWTGTLKSRTLSPDEAAGLGAIYGLPAPPGSASISGSVVRTTGPAVAGAHVVLEDAITGRVMRSVVTSGAGAFTFTRVPAGLYRIFVDPLDGPFTPANLTSGFSVSGPIDTTFRTTALGGLANPAVLSVKPGQSVNAGTIPVAGPASPLGVQQAFFIPTPVPGPGSTLERTAPYAGYAGIFGAGVNLAPDSGFRLSGPFLAFTGPSTWSSALYQDKIFPILIPAGTPPGAYRILVEDPANGGAALFAGGLEVLPGPAPLPWTAPYGVPCAGGAGPVSLAAAGSPAVGNAGFALTVTGTAGGQTAFVLLSLLPESLPILGTCFVSVDPALLLWPFPGIPVPTSPVTTTIPMPVPANPGLSGVTIYFQVVAVDPLAPAGVTITNGLAVHIE